MKEKLEGKKITRHCEIQFLFEKGKRLRGPDFDVIFLKNNLSHGRAGVVVGKKCGGAVDRNTIKRIFREILYHQKIDFNFPFDFIVVPKSESKKKLFVLLKQEVVLSIHKVLKHSSVQ